MRTRTLCAMFCLLGLALTAQAYRLQFKDPKGAVRSFRTTLHVQGTMEAMGMTLPMDSTIDMTSKEEVLSKKTGGSSISFSVVGGTLKATVTLPESEDENIEQPMPPFGFTYNRTPTGKVSNIEMTGEVDPEVQKLLDAMNGQMQYPGQGLEFPNKDLEIGDSWNGTQKFQLDAEASLDLKVKYTLSDTKELNGTTYLVIDCDINAKASDLSVKVPALTDGGEAPKLKVSMKITGNSIVLFDPEAGEVGDSSMTMDIDMTM